jgi:two-component system nitrogen regulation sensor histidine kinase NtrY
MTQRRFQRAIIIRLIGLVAGTILAAYLLFVRHQIFWSALSMVVVIGLAINTMYYFNLINRWIASFLLGIENEDTTLQIPEKTGNKAIDEIFRGMNRLNELFRKTKIEIGTQEQYYLSIINQSATGLFSVNEQGRIININPAAENLTGLIAFHHVNTLKRIDDGLPVFIMKKQELLESPSAIFENSQGQKLLFKVSEIKTLKEVIKLVVVSDITKELDIREVDAWIKLARTLSHEIMNNIAPITTLSQVTLNYFIREGKAVEPEFVDQETVKKTIKGLRVIEERSSGLKDFVENYRKFTKLPDPDFKKVDLTRLIGDVLLVCSGFDDYHQVKVEESLPDSVMANTDDNLLSQVLINIIKNALENIGEQEAGQNLLIKIKLGKDTNHIKIDICNNGRAIPPAIREQIFVPFFTTKESGTGIGLSLSKQIMLKLGGDIKLNPDKQNLTCFTISLPK